MLITTAATVPNQLIFWRKGAHHRFTRVAADSSQRLALRTALTGIL